jgi:hypothetical protein
VLTDENGYTPYFVGSTPCEIEGSFMQEEIDI